MAESTRLTGERPREASTPPSLLALHHAGYRALSERAGSGVVLDVGCGEGFETARLSGPGRRVLGVDYSREALRTARSRHADVLCAARMDALRLGLAAASVDWACSSHVIEHFPSPEPHVAELARVLRPGGTAFVLTPNAPADFENPFHVHLFDPGGLAALLGRHFAEVTVLGLDATDAVKEDFARRRAAARRLLALDVLDLRHRIPRSWYVAAYTRLLPLAYRLLSRPAAEGTSCGLGDPADHWFVTASIDATTPVLFATARGPRRCAGPAGRAGR